MGCKCTFYLVMSMMIFESFGALVSVRGHFGSFDEFVMPA